MAVRLNPVFLIGSWSSTKLSQSTTVWITNGVSYWVDWGDGTARTAAVGNGADQTVTHLYGAAGTYIQSWYIEKRSGLIKFSGNSNVLSGELPNMLLYPACTYVRFNTNSLTGAMPSFPAVMQEVRVNSNSLTGGMPDLTPNTAMKQFYCDTNASLTGSISSLSSCPGLTYFSCNSCNFTGSIPSLTANTLLSSFSCHINALTGSIPSLSTNAALRYFYCRNNALSGDIPSLTACVALVELRCDTNALTGYTPSTLAATITAFNVATNSMTLAALKLILADFLVSAAGPGRPAVCTISLGGVGNAALDAAALATKAAILGLQPGWVITNN